MALGEKHQVYTPSERIQEMAAASRARIAGSHDDNAVYAARHAEAFNDLFAHLPWRERQARTKAWGWQHLPMHIFPDDSLVGMTYHYGQAPQVADPLTAWVTEGFEKSRRELPEQVELVELRMQSPNVPPAHVTWRWDYVLEKGFAGMMEEYRQALDETDDEQAREFYQGVIICMEGVLAWNDRHISALEAMLAEAEPPRRANIERLIELCRRVPRFPARTFHEAVQSFWLQFLAVMRANPGGGNGPGRLDYFLWPYLERDLKNNTITMAEARELIDELFIKIHERIGNADTHVEAVVVGGIHPDGTSAVTPLSRLMVESIMGLPITHPSVYLRIPPDMPEDFIDLATDYLIQGQNRAQILNDRAIIPAMVKDGIAPDDANMYACGGCMEIAPHGMGSDLFFTGIHNVPKTVELVLTGGECLVTGKQLVHSDLRPLQEYDSFDELYAAFTAELRRELQLFFRRVDIYSEVMAELRPTYLLSSMIEDCFARGREQQDGGARYHDYGATPLGIPNAADALFAVKKAVFDDRICSADELLTAMRADFAGYELLRKKLLALPKFGAEHPEADAMADRVLATTCDIFNEYRNRFGGRFKLIVLTFVWAPEAGKVLGATAYGAHAGMPLAQSLSPQGLAMTEGITAAIGSHTALDLERVSGGASSMWDFDPHWASPQIVRSVLCSFLQMGGQIFQGNTTSVEELLQARETPEQYPHLMVRVGGFSARFVALNEDVQNEIITRYRHSG